MVCQCKWPGFAKILGGLGRDAWSVHAHKDNIKIHFEGSGRKTFEKSLFFDKEHILISKRYQLHPASVTMLCPSGNMDTHC
jgi:hypothetical protein